MPAQETCQKHLFLTHPDAARKSMGIHLQSLVAKAGKDSDVVGGRYSTACYITDSWPSILYLAYKYVNDLQTALLANTNLGGDNVHRGAVLGVILGLATGRTVEDFFNSLRDSQEIDEEISAIIDF